MTPCRKHQRCCKKSNPETRDEKAVRKGRGMLVGATTYPPLIYETEKLVASQGQLELDGRIAISKIRRLKKSHAHRGSDQIGKMV